MSRRSPAATPAQAVAAAIDTEQRSTEMATHLSGMTQAMMQTGVLYHHLGVAIATGPRPTTGAVRDAHRADLDAERAIRRFRLQMVMKAIEMRGDIKYDAAGHLDLATACTSLNAALKFLNASGGQIDAGTLKGLITHAGPMAKMMAPDAFYRTMLTVTEKLQQRAGTALSAAGRALHGGIVPSATRSRWSGWACSIRRRCTSAGVATCRWIRAH